MTLEVLYPRAATTKAPNGWRNSTTGRFPMPFLSPERALTWEDSEFARAAARAKSDLPAATGSGDRFTRRSNFGDRPLHRLRDLLRDVLPLRGVPPFGGRADRRVLTEEHERGQGLESERRHERAVGVDERRLARLLVAEDALRDGGGARDDVRGAAVAVPQDAEDALGHRDPVRGLGPVG